LSVRKKTSKKQGKIESKYRKRKPVVGDRIEYVHLALFNTTNIILRESNEEIKKSKNPRIKKKFTHLANVIEKELLA
jgi:hypothetical protein